VDRPIYSHGGRQRARSRDFGGKQHTAGYSASVVVCGRKLQTRRIEPVYRGHVGRKGCGSRPLGHVQQGSVG